MSLSAILKHIVVHVDDSSTGQDRLRFAASLAKRFDAFLTGIGEPVKPALEEQFGWTVEAHRLAGDWVDSVGAMAPFIAHRAHTADLVVLGQNDPNITVGIDGPEDVILACGRPVLVVPHGKPIEGVGDNVVVAWNNSREAALAVGGALALITKPNPVAIVSVNPHPDSDWYVGGDLVRQFARHGLPARAETITQDGRSPASLVRARAVSGRADLIVMGAYGHTRLREMVLGGMTRDMLAETRVPVLMAH